MYRLPTIAITQLLLCTFALAGYPESGCRAPDVQYAFYTASYDEISGMFPVGTKLTFRCSLEYELIGLQYATCLETGEWNSLPQCLSGCRPQEVANGNVQPAPDYEKGYYEYGEVIRVTCSYGYLLLGSVQATCKKGGMWTAYLQCVDGCAPPNVPNMLTLPRAVEGADVYKVNSTVHCRCTAGYSLSGSKSMKCKGGNEWNTELPNCQRKVHCTAPGYLTMVSYSPDKKRYAVGDKITWQCNEGNRMRGAKTSVCEQDGTFRPSMPTCEYVTDYEPRRPGGYHVTRRACYAPYLSNGVIISPDRAFYSVGAEVKFSCEPGYRMIGSAISICGKRGFREQPPTCQPITCHMPSLPSAGQCMETPRERYYYGDKICYICDLSYTMSGSDCITCQANGQFDERPPACRPESCQYGCSIKPGRSCQCDAECRYNGNCCKDFDQHCRGLFY